eukprot:NP_509292.1 Uncharacterized protein CELE_F27D9.4 [Caenorhabditis elegans]
MAQRVVTRRDEKVPLAIRDGREKEKKREGKRKRDPLLSMISLRLGRTDHSILGPFRDFSMVPLNLKLNAFPRSFINSSHSPLLPQKYACFSKNAVVSLALSLAENTTDHSLEPLPSIIQERKYALSTCSKFHSKTNFRTLLLYALQPEKEDSSISAIMNMDKYLGEEGGVGEERERKRTSTSS